MNRAVSNQQEIEHHMAWSLKELGVIWNLCPDEVRVSIYGVNRLIEYALSDG